MCLCDFQNKYKMTVFATQYSKLILLCIKVKKVYWLCSQTIGFTLPLYKTFLSILLSTISQKILGVKQINFITRWKVMLFDISSSLTSKAKAWIIKALCVIITAADNSCGSVRNECCLTNVACSISSQSLYKFLFWSRQQSECHSIT